MRQNELIEIKRECKDRQEKYKELFTWFYVKLIDKAVPQEKWDIAETAKAFYEDYFNLPWPVSIKWFTKQTPEYRKVIKEHKAEGFFEEFNHDIDINGCVRGMLKDKIWINVDQPIEGIPRTVFHELTHIRLLHKGIIDNQPENEKQEAEAIENAEYLYNIFERNGGLR